jgi:uncharacterized protein
MALEMPAVADDDGIIIDVRLTPRGGSDRTGPVEIRDRKPVLKIFVREPPEDGKANAALVRTIAHWLDVPKSRVLVRSGHRSRLKSVRVAGDPDLLMQRLKTLL